MKKLLFWMALMVGIISFIGACSKSEDSSTASTATSSDNTTSTLSAPSGATATLGWHQVAVDWTAVSGASSYTDRKSVV